MERNIVILGDVTTVMSSFQDIVNNKANWSMFVVMVVALVIGAKRFPVIYSCSSMRSRPNLFEDGLLEILESHRCVVSVGSG